MSVNKEAILDVKNLKQYFRLDRKNVLKAVDDVSFTVYKGETFGLVGESGSGKSTTGRSIIRLYNPTAGEVNFCGKKISGNIDKATEKILRTKMQMIFQDPMASLNPRKTVLDIVAQGLDIHGLYRTKEERRKKVYDILETVGLSREHAHRYPHEFSGGQRQRIGIARALVVNPDFVIADEAISALDVSIQAQVVNLLKKLQKERNLTYIFIAHDLSMVKYISDKIGVMHLGKMVELGPAEAIYNNAAHPYTKSLLSAIPHTNPILERTRKRIHYDKSNIDYDKGEFIEIERGHFVLGTKEEIKQWTA
ncbi:ABC transporter ATP-binding protein [Proteiniborus sp. MB09-C3]|uniref:ABC transporter ATP-binding protein n=1 Tax=Proteiniborus sp. MB09-C3 TaxID=3050072 RepID=UPI002557B4FB|nr:ABC transporter ATP-binding protein [Proteiniborus sp. MB09-C3]WIV13817.1 ABC transporter ATP-binding protein [Proteiniborus sp. MB09-C3]